MAILIHNLIDGFAGRVFLVAALLLVFRRVLLMVVAAVLVAIVLVGVVDVVTLLGAV